MKPTSSRLLHLTKSLSSSTSSAALHPPKPPPSFSTADPLPRLLRDHRLQEAAELLCRQRRLPDALRLLDLLDSSASPPPLSLHPSLLRLSLDLRSPAAALRVHNHATTAGLSPFPAHLSNRLIHLLAKSGALADARRVFDAMPDRDLCSWNTLIAGYSAAGDLAEARGLFDRMPDRDHFSWSTIISGHVRHGGPEEALDLYREMQNKRGDGRSDFGNKFTASSALAAATAVPCLRHGKEIHCHIIRMGFDSDAVVWSALSDMYAKCGSIDDARHVFDSTSDRDVVSWTAMIGRCFDGGQRKEGFELFSDMLRAGVRPNEFTFAGVLDACSELAMEGVGRQVHGHMIRIGYDPFSFAASALVHMYSKCGNIDKARNVFQGISKPDLVSWTSMISGYAQNGQPEKAIRNMGIHKCRQSNSFHRRYNFTSIKGRNLLSVVSH
ncbi:putative Pentatricopeptide repeat-containing protein [Cocos nucifera]|uniref:Putative Pentatricopeptide repeat-containing protein n=1 Tax=Cocos nucifera TaxID=13894 RepID=A0A8K0ITY8_COCNU|nr:putative Pentatricopeptide repeat-containing protein [Cocos nucifera]